MSKIEEIEQAVAQLPPDDFAKLAFWVDRRRQQLEIVEQAPHKSPAAARDHSAFLNSYALKDEWDADLSAMAADPEMQGELSRISSEFSAAESDGLGST